MKMSKCKTCVETINKYIEVAHENAKLIRINGHLRQSVEHFATSNFARAIDCLDKPKAVEALEEINQILNGEIEI